MFPIYVDKKPRNRDRTQVSEQSLIFNQISAIKCNRFDKMDFALIGIIRSFFLAGQQAVYVHLSFRGPYEFKPIKSPSVVRIER